MLSCDWSSDVCSSDLVDLVTDLPPSNGHDSLMVMVDHSLTKGVILIPCSKTIDAAKVAKLFLHHVFKRFDLHDSLISNRGPQFASAFARELAQLLHYNIKLSTTYHPQTDGQTEWTNQEVETYLHIFYANNPRKWTDFFPPLSFIIALSPIAPLKFHRSPCYTDMNREHTPPWERPSSWPLRTA